MRIDLESRSEIYWWFSPVAVITNARTPRIENRIDLEMIRANVLVLGEKDPLTLADERKKLDVALAGELVKGPGVVAL